jgi:hypothetical protein
MKTFLFFGLIAGAVSAVSQPLLSNMEVQDTGWVSLGPGQSARFSGLFAVIAPGGGALGLFSATLTIQDAGGHLLATQDINSAAGTGTVPSIVVNADSITPVGQRNILIHATGFSPNVGVPMGGGGHFIYGLDIIDNATGRTIAHIPAQSFASLQAATCPGQL